MSHLTWPVTSSIEMRTFGPVPSSAAVFFAAAFFAAAFFAAVFLRRVSPPRAFFAAHDRRFAGTDFRPDFVGISSDTPALQVGTTQECY